MKEQSAIVPEPLLTRAQVARMLGICPHTVSRLKDQLKPIRFNSRFIRYRRQDVEAFIHNNTQSPKQTP